MEVYLYQIILTFVLFGIFLPQSEASRNETDKRRYEDTETQFRLLPQRNPKRRIPRRKSGKIEVGLSEGSGNEPNATSFSEWEEWSRCKNCRQFRNRHCINIEECEDKIQKMYRPCHSSSNCKQKILIMMANRGDPKKRPKKVRIIRKLTPYFFTEWSDWSPCSSSCYTKRTRKCRFPGLCDNSSLREDYKQCYRDGDDCEKLFFEQQQRLFEYPKNIDESTESLKDNPLDNIECGIPNVSVPSVPPEFRRITGGRPSVKGAWPWQTLILNSDREPFCGGILLSDKWVLTAAHCIRKRLYVRAGEYDLSHYEKTEQEWSVSEFWKHPKYDQNTVDNDIALLKTIRPFQLNSYVTPICLPLRSDKLPEFARLTILGWGKRRNYSNYGTDILHEANVPIVNFRECQKSYHDQYISDNMLCAGFEAGLVDSCKGDSGGPLMYQRKDGTWAVFGVTSFGDGCGEAKKYGVYANVLKYLSWIRNIIKRGEISLYDDDVDY
ncbi:vitamin K-dependent protein C isoform X1 [Parasteatoda tepidariorum]|uniref:vitamin K-dependent protein C isoform X2 n=1 Tax=Parasteatoda tepidariorum TaxID=114398 RepID=UPI00077FE0E2|nr:vitamin K-dependent protein C isoform X2 [Parasteatoda tepidariorum]XP_042908780.1 vitamin K-dependent protein C isoform X1 [Parasteatoda tepidariorum]